MRRTVLRTITALAAMVASAMPAGCGAGSPPTTVPTMDGVPAVTATPGTAVAGKLVMIIRHGEKPDGSEPGVDAGGEQDDSSLTAVGWDRAHRLVGLFDPAQGPVRPGLARPAAIYAAGVTGEAEGQRTRETVTPLARALGIPLNTDLGRSDEKELAKDVADQPGPTLICWQHGGIPEIVAAFPHVTPGPPQVWPDDRFDVVWTLTKTPDGWRFAQLPELVLPQDQPGVIAG